MDSRTLGSRCGLGRRALVTRALGALILAAVAVPAMGASAAGCGDTDADGDGLTCYSEYNVYGTDDYNPDSDWDGLTDGSEVFYYGTNPLNADTDFDHADDGTEIAAGTDPLVPSRGGNALPGDDIDGDGLGDHEEVYIYGTDPMQFDTDGDALSDGTEVHLGTDPLNFYSK
jgi:hypothetical protein